MAFQELLPFTSDRRKFLKAGAFGVGSLAFGASATQEPTNGKPALKISLPIAGRPAEVPNGNTTIRASAGASQIVITTTARVAGAIDSLTWNGLEFINSYDHGRQLQSASNLDFGTPKTDETYNPTEAGSSRDGVGGTSSSSLLQLQASKNSLETLTQMAFWLSPDEKSGLNPAKNKTVLSDHLLAKRVIIGYENLPHVISYDVVFRIPVGEPHTIAVFEALTGYMPPEFAEFRQFNPQTGDLEPLSDGPGEVNQSVVFSLAGGTHAMGIYAPPQTTPHTTGPTYGRWRFSAEKVVKWNCVFRLADKKGIQPGDYAFQMFVIVGDVNKVRESLKTLHRMSAK